MNEFELIDRFFNKPAHRRDVLMGVGHDTALLKPPRDESVANTIDTLIENVHFLPTMSARDIGYKSLAVNLSDLAAVGATPAWFLLALTLPRVNEVWLEEFSQGLSELSERYDMDLVGGDTTCGPLTVITIQAQGFVPFHEAHARGDAKPGDLIFVTGTLGDAALGLELAKKTMHPSSELEKFLVSRYVRPMPRIEEGIALRGVASSAIDISDGLAADLSHILEMSQVGARIYIDKLPSSKSFSSLAPKDAYRLALSGGDDYELCFTVPPEKEAQMKKINCPVTQIGVIEKKPGLRILDKENREVHVDNLGYLHF